MKYLYLILIVGCISNIQAQDYQQIILNSLSSLNQLERPQGNNKYYFKYRVRVVPHGKEVAEISTTIETMVAKDRIVIKSPQGNYYQDNRYAFTVINDDRKVIWANPPSAEWQNQDFSSLIDVKKAFFKSSTYSRITRVNEPEGIMLIKVLPALEVRKKGTIDYMLVEVNTKKNQVVRMLTNYNQLAPQKVKEYVYEKIDLSSSIKIAKNVRDYVLKNNDQLQSSYKGYELIDLRKKK